MPRDTTDDGTTTATTTTTVTAGGNRLVGLVVKASALRAKDPGLEFHLRLDFFMVESYQ